jgi:exoribonuclease R
MSETRTYEGVITITRRGIGFFKVGDNKEDLLIPREGLNTALPGDIVKVALAGFIDNRRAGTVLAIVERAHDTFVGTIAHENGKTILLPDSKRMYTPLLLAGDGLPDGHKALVEFKGWDPGAPMPHAEVREIIGRDHRPRWRSRDRNARPGACARLLFRVSTRRRCRRPHA